jgi:hypothetical protein
MSSPLENLPVEVFGYILDLRGYQAQDPVPCCSRRCKQMWLEFAESKTRELADEFVLPFDEFVKENSLTERYNQVNQAVASYRQEIDSLSVEESMVTVHARILSLLGLNQIRSLEAYILKVSKRVLKRRMTEILQERRYISLFASLSVYLADRAKVLYGVESDQYREVYLYFLLTSGDLCLRSRNRELARKSLSVALTIAPLDIDILHTFAKVEQSERRVDSSLEALQTAIRTAGTDPVKAANYLDGLCNTLLKGRSIYGYSRTGELLAEASSFLQDLLARDDEPRMMTEEVRRRLFAARSKILLKRAICTGHEIFDIRFLGHGREE